MKKEKVKLFFKKRTHSLTQLKRTIAKINGLMYELLQDPPYLSGVAPSITTSQKSPYTCKPYYYKFAKIISPKKVHMPVHANC